MSVSQLKETDTEKTEKMLKCTIPWTALLTQRVLDVPVRQRLVRHVSSCHHGQRHFEDNGVSHRTELNEFIICVLILLNASSNFSPK